MANPPNPSRNLPGVSPQIRVSDISLWPGPCFLGKILPGKTGETDPPGDYPGCGGLGGGGLARVDHPRDIALFKRSQFGLARGRWTKGPGVCYLRASVDRGFSPFSKFPNPAPTRRKMPEIAKVRYTHDAMIDLIIERPEISQRQLAQEFGFTESWVSIVINSDAFQERLAHRKAVLVDPRLVASIEDRLDSLARRSLDKLLERLDNNQPISNGDLVRMAQLGVGDRNKQPQGPAVENNLYVVNIPPKASNSQDWLNSAQGAPAPLTLENGGS